MGRPRGRGLARGDRAARIGTRPATIVVLEQNAAARELIDRTLRESGDRVLVTHDPIEALELARRVQIDLLVSEPLLDQDEQQLLNQLRSFGPGLRVLSLGSREEPSPAEPGSHSALRTPYTLEELRQAVADALGRRT